ncbi:5-formyltetrahydrofolate cyclo-ligase [Nocardia panacis]|uniref:5-formyltetrahydrofolate cyclo-ligase n=1 Tax=Nocardia panacis TaxID=2340916 RepID=A0A3A4K5W1_9NOCA|nr:5-formyltetrahydrofolate cyclo-ligase [Nocardia panacis]RJO76389.1 5-formyltetrahydrofolate cyclo-ligase [Nocardia panacis]
MNVPGDGGKYAWRTEIRTRRLAVPREEREREAEALAEGVAALNAHKWVCAYMPVGAEPGSIAMLDALRAVGARVLLPITAAAGPLLWAEYTDRDSLQRARFGLLEPTGATLPAAAIGWAELVLVPAMAVDRRGVRLGRGAGYYDRTLTAAREDARLVAVVRDEELVERLPEEPHDQRMGWAMTPFGGLRRLGGTEAEESSSAG